MSMGKILVPIEVVLILRWSLGEVPLYKNFIFIFSGCERDLDIVLLIDISNSVKDDFPVYIQQLVELTRDFSIGPDKDRFGAVTFETTAKVLFTLDELNTSAQVSSAINSIPGPGVYTNMAAAFRYQTTNSTNLTRGAGGPRSHDIELFFFFY